MTQLYKQALQGKLTMICGKDPDGKLWAKLVVDSKAGKSVQIGIPGAGVSTVGTGPGGAFDAGARLEVSR